MTACSLAWSRGGRRLPSPSTDAATWSRSSRCGD